MKQCCTNHNGNIKQKYNSQEEAENAAYDRKVEGVTVSVYPCEDGDGWHLTSKSTEPLERPIREMTPVERKLYTKTNKNRMGSLFDEDLISQIRSEAENNTLHILKRKIEPLQLEFNEIYRNLGTLRREYKRAERKNEDLASLRDKYLEAEASLKVARKQLRAAKQEYEYAKRRIERSRSH